MKNENTNKKETKDNNKNKPLIITFEERMKNLGWNKVVFLN